MASEWQGAGRAYWVGPRHLAGDDGRLYDAVADVLGELGWTSLTTVRGRREPDEAPEDRQVLRSTVLYICPGALRWVQWVLADEPFHLGHLPIDWQVSARTDTSSPAEWSAYFTTGEPGEAVADFLVALDARNQPAAPLVRPDLVVDAATAHGWLRDIDQPAAATDPSFISCLSLGEVPPLIQDADPRTLATGPDEPGPIGWQAWVEPAPGAPNLWAASLSASVPHDLVAAFAVSSARRRQSCVRWCPRRPAGDCHGRPPARRADRQQGGVGPSGRILRWGRWRPLAARERTGRPLSISGAASEFAHGY